MIRAFAPEPVGTQFAALFFFQFYLFLVFVLWTRHPYAVRTALTA